MSWIVRKYKLANRRKELIILVRLTGYVVVVILIRIMLAVCVYRTLKCASWQAAPPRPLTNLPNREENTPLRQHVNISLLSSNLFLI